MAGSGKSMAMLATLMFAMLLSGSMVNAARPIGVNGGEIAAVQPHSRQLNFFFHKFYGCGWFFWWGCGPRYYVQPVPVPAPAPEEDDDDKRRKLQSVADTDSTLSLPANGGDASNALQANGRELNFFWFKRGCWFWWCKKGDDDDKYYGRKLQSTNSRQLNFFFGKFHHGGCWWFWCKKGGDDDYKYGRKLNFFLGHLYKPFWFKPVKVVYQPKYQPKYEEPKYDH